ncbi:MAG: ABC transporter ATP-binding protein [Actinomycetota bacterium]
MAEPLLQVKDLRTYFTTHEGVVRAVDGVTFTIDKGEKFGVVGESGCGKSVCALSVMRLIERPAGEIVTGQVLFHGLDLLRLTEDEMRFVRGGQIAMIFQDPMTALNPVFTIGNQLMETIMLHQRVGKSEAFEIAVQGLDDVHIPKARQRMGDYPHQLSGGMRQRVMIAMALSCNPDLLIADEPTTALDVTTQAQILDVMHELTEGRDTAVMLITHDLGVVAGFCDRIQVMYAGRLVETGTADEVFFEGKHPYTAGLLGSMTRMDQVRTERLFSIRGAPPSLINPPRGCRFWPRCDFADAEVCRKTPRLRELSQDHYVACHFAPNLDLRRVEKVEKEPAA